MKIYSGDIINVKNIIFKDGEKDHAINGRPCIVLYVFTCCEGKNHVVFLPISTKVEHLEQNITRERYVRVMPDRKPQIIDVDKIITKEVNNDITEVIHSIGFEYFSIVEKVIKNTVYKNFIHKQALTEILKEEKESLKETLQKRRSKFNNKIKYLYHKNEFDLKNATGPKNGGVMAHKKKKTLEYRYQKEEEKKFMREIRI